MISWWPCLIQLSSQSKALSFVYQPLYKCVWLFALLTLAVIIHAGRYQCKPAKYTYSPREPSCDQTRLKSSSSYRVVTSTICYRVNPCEITRGLATDHLRFASYFLEILSLCPINSVQNFRLVPSLVSEIWRLKKGGVAPNLL